MSTGSWWLDERAHAGAEHLDPAYVAGYDRKAGFDPAADVSLLRDRGVGPDTVVVDMGAGTGTFTAAIAPWCARVVAVDVSPAMVAALRSRTRALRNVEVVEAGFLSYEHAGPPADVVFSRNALHQLPDFWKAVALDRVAGFLRPGGLLRLHDLVYDFDPGEAAVRIPAWLSGAVDDPAAGWTAAELAEHVRGEFSTYAWLLEPMLDRTGFDVVDRAFRRGAYGAYTCRRRAVTG
jgi:SAM-dependent methyltransferase